MQSARVCVARATTRQVPGCRRRTPRKEEAVLAPYVCRMKRLREKEREREREERERERERERDGGRDLDNAQQLRSSTNGTIDCHCSIRLGHTGPFFRAADTSIVRGSAVAEPLARSPPTKANRVQSPAGSPDSRMWELCRTMPLVVKIRLNLFTHSIVRQRPRVLACNALSLQTIGIWVRRLEDTLFVRLCLLLCRARCFLLVYVPRQVEWEVHTDLLLSSSKLVTLHVDMHLTVSQEVLAAMYTRLVRKELPLLREVDRRGTAWLEENWTRPDKIMLVKFLQSLASMTACTTNLPTWTCRRKSLGHLVGQEYLPVYTHLKTSIGRYKVAKKGLSVASKAGPATIKTDVVYWFDGGPIYHQNEATVVHHVSSSVSVHGGAKYRLRQCSGGRLNYLSRVAGTASDAKLAFSIKTFYAAQECKGGGNARSPRKSADLRLSSGTIPTCEIPGATLSGIEHSSRRWEASSLTTAPPPPLDLFEEQTYFSSQSGVKQQRVENGRETRITPRRLPQRYPCRDSPI
ncbi:hypothetical protein PR048_006477 [Dryococelus australis]|uniref:Uncharacterized protein n=1 Tax=Dryococelus australis TaxID=614101 RepID=A0ABQ9IB50_9NEOP|nr:hypothetical protein PR048_006477 [Dryococelus australis]